MLLKEIKGNLDKKFRPEVETTHTLEETQNLLAAINHGKGQPKR
jgi:hypothetical protein